MRNQDFSRGHCQFVEEGTVLQSLAYNGSREWVYSPSPRIPEAWGAQGGVESSSSSSGRAGRAWWRETAECSPQHGSDTFQHPPPAPCGHHALCLLFPSLLSGKCSVSPELKFREIPAMLLGLLSGKWLVSTMVLIPQTSTFMLSAQFREAGCLGPQTATAHSYVLGLSPQTQPRPWNCRMPPPQPQ